MVVVVVVVDVFLKTKQGLNPPQHAEHMGDILISETMADFDQDGDGKLDLAE